MLEVVESDFTKSLAEGTAKEAMAVEEYEKLTQDNKIATTEKTTAVKYKNKDKKETEEMLVSLKEDKATVEKEYEKLTQDNKIATTEKSTAVKYKTKDKKETEEMLVSLKEDKATVDKEYAAVMEYWEELQGMCT